MKRLLTFLLCLCGLAQAQLLEPVDIIFSTEKDRYTDLMFSDGVFFSDSKEQKIRAYDTRSQKFYNLNYQGKLLALFDRKVYTLHKGYIHCIDISTKKLLKSWPFKYNAELWSDLEGSRLSKNWRTLTAQSGDKLIYLVIGRRLKLIERSAKCAQQTCSASIVEDSNGQPWLYESRARVESGAITVIRDESYTIGQLFTDKKYRLDGPITAISGNKIALRDLNCFGIQFESDHLYIVELPNKRIWATELENKYGTCDISFPDIERFTFLKESIRAYVSSIDSPIEIPRNAESVNSQEAFRTYEWLGRGLSTESYYFSIFANSEENTGKSCVYKISDLTPIKCFYFPDSSEYQDIVEIEKNIYAYKRSTYSRKIVIKKFGLSSL